MHHLTASEVRHEDGQTVLILTYPQDSYTNDALVVALTAAQAKTLAGQLKPPAKKS